MQISVVELKGWRRMETLLAGPCVHDLWWM
jgi:hypothetical protein